MQYKVTKQFARDTETPLAEFIDSANARFFIEEKINFDALSGTRVILRLFDKDHLLNEFNKDKITTIISRAQYANGDTYIPNSFSLTYKVSQESSQSMESKLAEFNNVEDATVFVNAKLSRDARNKLFITYRLYDHTKLLETFDQESTGRKASQGSQDQKKSVSFRPTPLNISPRPPGSPPNWLIDDEDEIDKKA